MAFGNDLDDARQGRRVGRPSILDASSEAAE